MPPVQLSGTVIAERTPEVAGRAVRARAIRNPPGKPAYGGRRNR